MNAQELKKFLNLKPLPEEGGFYFETFRSEIVLKKDQLDPKYDNDRVLFTDIYYMLEGGERSRLHRLKSDEVWYFHMGASMNIIDISPDGKMKKIKMGHDLSKGEVLRHHFKPNHWFGAYLDNDEDYSLVSCIVAPGFEFQDFELVKRDDLNSLSTEEIQFLDSKLMIP